MKNEIKRDIRIILELIENAGNTINPKVIVRLTFLIMIKLLSIQNKLDVLVKQMRWYYASISLNKEFRVTKEVLEQLKLPNKEKVINSQEMKLLSYTPN